MSTCAALEPDLPLFRLSYLLMRPLAPMCAPLRPLTPTHAHSCPPADAQGELLALLELVVPSLFGGTGQLLEQLSVRGGETSASAIARVRHMLAPFILRRLKSEVLQQLSAKARYRPARPASPRADCDHEGVWCACIPPACALPSHRLGATGVPQTPRRRNIWRRSR